MKMEHRRRFRKNGGEAIKSQAIAAWSQFRRHGKPVTAARVYWLLKGTLREIYDGADLTEVCAYSPEDLTKP